MERRILYLDDDPAGRQRFEQTIEQQTDIEIDTVASIEAADDHLTDHDYQCLVTDTGFDPGSLSDIMQRYRGLIAIVFSDDDIDAVDPELLQQAYAFVSKDDEDAYSMLVDQIDTLLADRSEIDYPVPKNEQERLTELQQYDVERLTESKAFEKLTEIGSKVFDAKWCFFGLIMDEEEVFLAFHGSSTERLERSCTICTFTIERDETMIVEDRSTDPRFKYVDELADMGIEWYAGAPIVTDAGNNLGAFCIADTEAQEFDAQDRELLQLFAAEAMDKIKLLNQTLED